MDQNLEARVKLLEAELSRAHQRASSGFYTGNSVTVSSGNGTAANPYAVQPTDRYIKFSGPGTLDVGRNGEITYPSGTGEAATVLKVGSILLNNQSKACVIVPSATTTALLCNLSVTPAQFDTSLGATQGCFLGLGAKACNAGLN